MDRDPPTRSIQANYVREGKTAHSAQSTNKLAGNTAGQIPRPVGAMKPKPSIEQC
ncbi:hypothetical protein [Undibacterium sp.]|uniref:hypothetical protein n=1 Tax=Undibacterium sp. TaxID=1914977 RepID=UPI00375218FB